jgi:hypothetical protein
MKNILVVGCVLAASAFPVMAADMPLKAPPPPPAPVFTWNGCYLGGSVGGIWRQTDNVTVGVVDGGSGAATAAAAGAIPTAFSVGSSSFIGGGQAGCNYQAASWVLGIETDFSGTKLDGSQTIATNVATFFPLTSSASQDMSWIGTTRGRLGWAWGNVLVYATAGAATDHRAARRRQRVAAEVVVEILALERPRPETPFEAAARGPAELGGGVRCRDGGGASAGDVVLGITVAHMGIGGAAADLIGPHP